MFTFFRKYQRFIYLIVTAVIILSFSFFGTYSAFTSGKGDDPVIFKTVAGKKITRSDFNDYVHFLSMDATGGEGHAANLLNDGVIERDILSSPVGVALTKQFGGVFSKEWGLRFKREKLFQAYKHPQAPFISAEQIWSYFAPELKRRLEVFQEQEEVSPVDFFNKKTDLYTAEKEFPSVYLRQILQYQQKQLEWLEPDPSLESRPLSLFGYQQIADWFGQSFIEKSAEFVIQMAAKARMMGMTVSRSEVLASLYKNAQTAAKRYGDESKAPPDELMKRSLLSLGMDESRAIRVWGDVLLMRRALLELPRKIILSPSVFTERLQSEAETLTVDGFQLQPPLRLEGSRDLFKVETWLNAVTKMEKMPSLIPSTQFRSCDEVQASFPEFVERRFVVNVASVDTTKLASHIRMKDIWAWQNDHWEELTKEIPILKDKETPDRESRFRALENLVPQFRTKADEIAKKALTKLHGEWITQQLEAIKPETKVLGIRLQGGPFSFEGIKDRRAFVKELSDAPIGEESPLLSQYTQDGVHFYRITILDRKTADEFVPLPDLLADGTLDTVLDRILEAVYERVRADNPSEFKKDNGTWKHFADVKDAVAERHFAPFLKKLEGAVREWKEKFPSYCLWDDPKVARVGVRFLPLLAGKAQEMQAQGEDAGIVTSPYVVTDKESLSLERRPWSDVFTLTKFSERVRRGDLPEKPMFKDAFTHKPDSWLTPRYSQDLGPFVAKVVSHMPGEYKETMRKIVYALQKKLGEEMVAAKAEAYMHEFFGQADTHNEK